MSEAPTNQSNNVTSITESEFFMWRAIFSFAYVDNMLSMEEQELLNSYLAQVPFSKTQRIILKDDLRHPKDVSDLYGHITRSEDKTRFCVLARAIAWCEGDISAQEKQILKKMSCMGVVEEQQILHQTRGHAHVEAYYHQYAKSGMMGLFHEPHLLEIRV